MVTERSLLQPFLQGFGAGRGDVVLYSPVDEAAALAGPGQAVNGSDRRFRQDDIDAFCHGIEVNDPSSTLYTHRVCMSNRLNDLRPMFLARS